MRIFSHFFNKDVIYSSSEDKSIQIKKWAFFCSCLLKAEKEDYNTVTLTVKDYTFSFQSFGNQFEIKFDYKDNRDKQNIKERGANILYVDEKTLKINRIIYINRIGNNTIKLEYIHVIDSDKILKTYYYNDKMHREGDKPSHKQYKKGKLIYKSYMYMGRPYRFGDKPSDIYYKDGIVSSKIYRKGCRHREGDKPTFKYYVKGKLIIKMFHKNGDLHREGDKPSAIMLDEEGNILEEYYHKKGNLHREGDKPAVILRDKYLNIIELHFFINNYYHRKNSKPAYILFDEKGRVLIEKYFYNGYLFNKNGAYWLEYNWNKVIEKYFTFKTVRLYDPLYFKEDDIIIGNDFYTNNTFNIPYNDLSIDGIPDPRENYRNEVVFYFLEDTVVKYLQK